MQLKIKQRIKKIHAPAGAAPPGIACGASKKSWRFEIVCETIANK
jgi:hypothetical protein